METLQHNWRKNNLLCLLTVFELKLCLAQSFSSAPNTRLVSSIAQHITAYPICSFSHNIPLHHSAWCLSAGCALWLCSVLHGAVQSKFKCWPSLSCLLPKASSVLTTHTLSLNDQSASLEVKREGGAQGPSITKEPQLIGCMENRSEKAVQSLLFTT